MIRTNGSFVAGYELRGILAYFATDGDQNQTKAMLEVLFRSVPDVSMRVQFRYEISEHLGDLLDNYIDQQRTGQSEVMALDKHRLRMWQQKEQTGFYFENRLHVYLIWDPRIHAKLYHSAQQNRKLGGFTISQKKAIQRTRKEHEAYLPEFESIVRGIEGSMEAANLGPGGSRHRTYLKNSSTRSTPSGATIAPSLRGEEMKMLLPGRELSMCKIQVIRKEPGLIAIPFEKAIYCHCCEQITNSVWARCGLCGSDSILQLIRLLGDSPDPEPTPPTQTVGAWFFAA